tara:strand:- start:2775 stop:2951 length:177 start_codon:yes stop_codon:yes gene_type:complete
MAGTVIAPLGGICVRMMACSKVSNNICWKIKKEDGDKEKDGDKEEDGDREEDNNIKKR